MTGEGCKKQPSIDNNVECAQVDQVLNEESCTVEVPRPY